MTFIKFWEEKYAPNYKVENPNSYGGVAGTIENYLLPRFGEKKLEDIDQPDVDNLRKELIELGRKQTSMNKVLRHFRSILVKAEEYRYITTYPKFKLFKESDKRERMVLSNEEFQAVKNYAPKYLQPMMVIQRETFCRPGELLKLKWEDVDIEERKIIVVEPKGGKTRTIYFSRNTSKLFQELLKNQNGNEFVFPVKRNKYFADFKKASEGAGFKDKKQFKPHDLRSTGASIALINGVDINTIKKCGGWKDLSVLQEIYLKSNPEQQRKAAEVVDSNGN
jgi:integrase